MTVFYQKHDIQIRKKVVNKKFSEYRDKEMKGFIFFFFLTIHFDW